MSIRTAISTWSGDLKTGTGKVKLGSGILEAPYSFSSRFEEGAGTNPEELLGASIAGCYGMFLSAILSKDGFIPTSIETTARVHLGDGPKVTLIELSVQAEVPKIDKMAFQTYTETARDNCPISVALSAVEKKLTATLKQTA